MRSFRRGVLITGLGVAGLLLAAVFAFIGPRPGVAACMGLSSQSALERCLADAMVAAGSPSEAAITLGEVLDDDEVQLACHEASHEAGTRLYRDTDGVSAFLTDPVAGVCEWGLEHGLLSAMVAGTPSRVELEGLLEVCGGAADRGVQQACGDSVGHAVWEVERAFPDGVGLCMAAPSPVGDACVSGVFMQLYRPVAPSSAGDAVWSPPLSRGEVLDLCRDLGAPRAEEACAAAAHYAFAPDLQAARDEVLDASDRTAAAGEIFVPILEDGLEFCTGFAGPGAERCAMELSRYALQMLRYLPSDPVEALVCGRVPAGTVLSHCRNAAAVILSGS